jgi:integrase
MVLVSLNTGLRRGELVSLTWDWFDMDNRILTGLGVFGQSGQTRHIPLDAEAIDVLTRWGAQCGEGERLFPLRTVNNSWPALRAAAKLKDFRWHDLPHLCCATGRCSATG